jgi:hypothetical protein
VGGGRRGQAGGLVGWWASGAGAGAHGGGGGIGCGQVGQRSGGSGGSGGQIWMPSAIWTLKKEARRFLKFTWSVCRDRRQSFTVITMPNDIYCLGIRDQQWPNKNR